MPTTLRLLALSALIVTRALGAPGAGATVPPVQVTDTQDHQRKLPTGKLPVLIFYEDKDAGAQNMDTRKGIGRFTDNRDNASRFELMAIADVEKWNFWPAKKYVLDDVRASEKKDGTPIWLDWTGEVRKSWGLTAGRSGVLLIDGDGKVRFAFEGPLGPARIDELCKRLVELGAVPRK